MLEEARAYVAQTLARLPNFFATRTTERYYGIPPGLNEASRPALTGLFPRGSYSREITFRDGKELIDPMKNPQGQRTTMSLGLESSGEFGIEPGVVLTDVTSNTIAFHHWEKGPTGVVAVFRYSVSKQDSHYDANYSCNGRPTFHGQPAYHGTIALDPASGVVLRVTIEAADTNADDPLSHVASAVEYADVNAQVRVWDIKASGEEQHSGESPLTLALQSYHHKEVVKLLLTHGADVNVELSNGNTPLSLAIDQNLPQDVQVLLANGANPDYAIFNGQSAVHQAVLERKIEILKLLLDYGADPNAKDLAKHPPMFYADTDKIIGILSAHGGHK
jgi:hypothetical protein